MLKRFISTTVWILFVYSLFEIPKKYKKNQKNKYIKGLEITSMKTKTHCVASFKSIQALFLQYLYILTGLVRQTSKPLSSFILTFFFYIDVLRTF